MTMTLHFYDNFVCSLLNTKQKLTHNRGEVMKRKFPGISLFLTLFSIVMVRAEANRLYINQVHEQYLMTDFKNESDVLKLLVAIKQGLEKAQSVVPEDFVAEENLLGLYNKILKQAQEVRSPKGLIEQASGKVNLESIFGKLKEYEDKNGKVIPTGWSLPEEFVTLVAGVEKKYDAYKGKMSYSFGLYGWQKKNTELAEQIQVSRFPNTVLLNKEKKIGFWEDGRTWSEPKFVFDFWTEKSPNPPKEGLYLVLIKMKGKAPVQGWFIMSHMNIAESPIVSSPYIGQIFKSEHPVMSWLDFTSSLHRDFESRKRSLTVWKVLDETRKLLWERTEIAPDRKETIKIVDATDNHGHSSVKLTPGNYEYQVDFQERWFFGDLILQRGSATKVPFSVISH